MPITILELVLTLIPFSFLYMPFIFFRKKWNKRIKSNRLFRLLFVIKVQFGIVLIGGLLLSKWTGAESIYIFIENFIWLIFIIFISALPFLLKLRLYQKIIWTFTNYVFSLLFFLLIGLVLYLVPDLELITDKTTLKTPNYEHLMFEFDYEYSDLRLDTQYFIALMHDIENKAYLRNTQFATIPLTLELMEVDTANLNGAIRYKDSLENLSDTQLENDLSNYKQLKIETEYLDSLRLDFNQSFFGDKNLTDSLSQYAKFESNKSFYKLINMQLSHFDSIYKDDGIVVELFKTKPEFVLNSNENVIVGLFKFEDDVLAERKNKIELFREKLKKREKYSSFFQNVYVFPVEFIFDQLD